MDASSRETAFLYFVCGLAWLSIALGMALARRNSRRQSAWLIACFALEGAAAWIGAVTASAGRPLDGSGAVFDFALLAISTGSVVALIEYGQRRLARHRTLLPGRWVYALLAAWAGIGPFVVERGWLATGPSLLFAWPGVIAPGLFLCALAKNERMIARCSLAMALGLLLVSAIAGRLPLGIGQPALAILAAGAVWRVFDRGRSTRPAPVWRRAAAPAGFALALVAGWFALASRPASQPDVNPLDEQAIASLLESSEEAEAPGVKSDLDRQLERCGIAVAPILGLVLAVWGLSRLPFAR